MNENKHYIRLDSDGYVIAAYSDEFESVIAGDICIEENGGRQLVIQGETNPGIFSVNGAPLYKYENGIIIKKEKLIPIQPRPISDSERITILEAVIDELVGGAANG